MRPLSLIVLAGSLFAVAVRAQDDKIVPVHQEPRHHLVLDVPGTRILDVQIPPGDTTLYHTHSDPILYVTMSNSQTRSQTLGRDWTGGDAATRTEPGATADVPPRAPAVRPGRMTSTTSYANTPLTHRVHNVGPTLFRLIGITNSSAGDDSTAPGAGFDAAPEITNRWFRGYRWALTREALAHRHDNPVAIVLITGRAFAAGTTKKTLDEPGSFAWIDANSAHSLQAIGDAAEVVEVEVRRPR